jgi:hypothetical protein
LPSTRLAKSPFRTSVVEDQGCLDHLIGIPVNYDHNERRPRLGRQVYPHIFCTTWTPQPCPRILRIRGMDFNHHPLRPLPPLGSPPGPLHHIVGGGMVSEPVSTQSQGTENSEKGFSIRAKNLSMKLVFPQRMGTTAPSLFYSSHHVDILCLLGARDCGHTSLRSFDYHCW